MDDIIANFPNTNHKQEHIILDTQDQYTTAKRENDDPYNRIAKGGMYPEHTKQTGNLGELGGHDFSLPYGRGLQSIDNSFDNNIYFGMPENTPR